jgi:UDP-N-acetylmuramate dehydrogenase
MAQSAGLPRFVLGGGSNIVLRDDYPGLVLHMGIKGMELIGEDDRAFYVKAGAGESWHVFVLWTLAQGWGGLENLSLIPGSVGAAPIQNVGAYGIEVKDRLHALTAFDFDSGETFTLTNAECEFAYRDSVFKHRLCDRAAVLDVTFALPKAWQPNTSYADVSRELHDRGIAAPTARDISDAVIAIRSRKLPDPARIGNAGSFFKNPIVPAAKREQLLAAFPQLVSYPQADGSYKLAAGWLIEQCGWKGKSVGAAGVYERQALVLVNRGGARGKDILNLAQAIRNDVSARFGVDLEMEPVLV